VAPPSFRYRSFELGIRSSIELPELLAAEDPSASIEIRQGTFHHASWTSGQSDEYRRDATGHLLFPHETGWFRLSDSGEIIVEVSAGADPAILRLILLGRAMGALLQWRGLLALHAGAVVTQDDEAILVIGPSGAGKSSTVAALVAAGFPLLSDEIVAIDFARGHPLALPGYPSIRLTSQTASQLLGRGFDEPTAGVKQYVGLHDRAHRAPASVRAVYALQPGSETGTEVLPVQTALRILLGNSYSKRLIGVTKTTDLHLTQCSTLAASARVVLVTVDRDVTDPAGVAGLIERDLALVGRVQKRS
jgi:hypothetical protein